jgi:hypothetical protein
MSNRIRPLATLVPLVLVALVGAGCTHAADERGTDGKGSTGSAGRAKAVQFSQCMRDHGVEKFPDPDSSGALTVDEVANGSTVDTTSPSFDRALSACRDLQPAGFTGRKRTAAQQKTSLEFARCIRDHGVKDFPDPDPNGPLVDTNRIPSASQEGGMSVLNSAMQACGKVYAGRLALKP